MKFLTILPLVLILTGCAVNVSVDGIVSNGCVWTSDMYLSEPSIKALRDAQKEHPEVRIDREKIVTHNRLYEEYCPPETK